MFISVLNFTEIHLANRTRERKRKCSLSSSFSNGEKKTFSCNRSFYMCFFFIINFFLSQSPLLYSGNHNVNLNILLFWECFRSTKFRWIWIKLKYTPTILWDEKNHSISFSSITKSIWKLQINGKVLNRSMFTVWMFWSRCLFRCLCKF